MADDLKVNSNTDILEFKRKFNLFVSNYDKGEFDGDFEITGDLTVDGDVEIKGELKGAETQIANAVSEYITEHPFAPSMLTGEDIAPDDISATGIITGAEIKENMSGYTASITQKENLSNTPIYAGVVKNGNKITFVYFATIKRTGNIDGFALLCNFNIPASIGSRLYPYSVGTSGNILDYKQVGLIKKSDASFLNVNLKIYKSGDTQINVMGSSGVFDSMVLDADYLVRYEVTFLLSDNLLSNE